MKKSDNLADLWFAYNGTRNEIARALGRTSNIESEFSELLVAQHYDGALLPASSSSADILLLNGKKIQVKARIPRQGSTTSLGVIRSWDFDLLVVVIFNVDGTLGRAVELSSSDAKRLSVPNKHQNGWVITTTKDFYGDPSVRDITKPLKETMLSLGSRRTHVLESDQSGHDGKQAFSGDSRHQFVQKVDSTAQNPSAFKSYLLSTSSPKTGMKYSPGTVSSYISGINTVCKEEGCCWEDLAPQIGSLVFRYGPGGDKDEIGRKGKNTVINALRAYQRFTGELRSR